MVYIYDSKTFPNLKDWIKERVLEGIKAGYKRPSYYYKNLLNEHSRPIYQERTWEKYLQNINKELKIQSENTSLSNEKLLEELNKRTNDKGVVQIPSNNNKNFYFVQITKTADYSSKAQVNRLNQQVQSVFEIQSSNTKSRIEEFVKSKEVKKIATEALKIPGWLSSSQATTFKNKHNFSFKNLFSLRDLGFQIPSSKLIQKKEEEITIPFISKVELLEAKPKKNEKVIIENNKKYVQRQVITSKLKDALKFFLSNSEDSQPWVNIPQDHTAPSIEIRKKIQLYQELIQYYHKLNDNLEKIQKEEKEKEEIENLTKILIKTGENILKLHEELKIYQDNSGEQFVMLTGDYGGGSFKLLFQDLCCVNPTSLNNSIMVGYMEADDSYSNMKKAFGHFQVNLYLLVYCFYFIFLKKKQY